MNGQNHQHRDEIEFSLPELESEHELKMDIEQEESHDDSANDFLAGIIIARMPDIGDCRAVPTVTESKHQNSRPAFQKALEKTLDDGRVLFIRLSGRLNNEVQNFTSRFRPDSTNAFSEEQKRVFYGIATVFGLALLLGGIMLLPGKDKSKETASTTKTESVLAFHGSDQGCGHEHGLESPTTFSSVTNYTPSIHGHSGIVENDAENRKNGFAVTSPVPAAANDKIASDAKSASGIICAVDPANNPTTTGVAHHSQTNSDSPWDRPATDNYSPWSMSSTDRLEAVAARQRMEATIPTTTETVASGHFPNGQQNLPLANPTMTGATVAMVPMNPINPMTHKTEAPMAASNMTTMAPIGPPTGPIGPPISSIGPIASSANPAMPTQNYSGYPNPGYVNGYANQPMNQPMSRPMNPPVSGPPAMQPMQAQPQGQPMPNSSMYAPIPERQGYAVASAQMNRPMPMAGPYLNQPQMIGAPGGHVVASPIHSQVHSQGYSPQNSSPYPPQYYGGNGSQPYVAQQPMPTRNYPNMPPQGTPIMTGQPIPIPGSTPAPVVGAYPQTYYPSPQNPTPVTPYGRVY